MQLHMSCQKFILKFDQCFLWCNCSWRYTAAVIMNNHWSFKVLELAMIPQQLVCLLISWIFRIYSLEKMWVVHFWELDHTDKNHGMYHQDMQQRDASSENKVDIFSVGTKILWCQCTHLLLSSKGETVHAGRISFYKLTFCATALGIPGIRSLMFVCWKSGYVKVSSMSFIDNLCGYLCFSPFVDGAFWSTTGGS